jgi:hemerythrin
MALTTWKDSYSVGVQQLDAQHRHVFEMINELAFAMRSGQGDAAIQPILARLTEHLRTHIESEEELMRRTSYPDLAAHHEEHSVYLLRVGEFKTNLGKAGNEDTISLLYILRDMILDHMLQADLAYAVHVNASGIH